MYKKFILSIIIICTFVLMTAFPVFGYQQLHKITFEQATYLNRIATIETAQNISPKLRETKQSSAEIVASSNDGDHLVYTDSPSGGLGFISLQNPNKPLAMGFLKLSGEPTSVILLGDMIFVGLNTSQSFTQPSGKLLSLSFENRQIIASCDLQGQPDSIAISKDKRWLAVAIENERDEDFNKGKLPQFPAGKVIIIPLMNGFLECDNKKEIELIGIAEVAGDDPEPEYVDFNDENELVVSLQENNHIVIIDVETAQVINHFSAGEVNLQGIDVTEDGALNFVSNQTRKREPDAVKWLDNQRFVTANEGDYVGGSRGFSIFNKQGEVLFDSGTEFEHAAASAGHYPEKRSENKGIEPEGLEVATFYGRQYIFVMAERGSVVGVYRDTGFAPEFVQLLPSGAHPESAVAIPSRNLFITANEKDLLTEQGARANIMIYQFGNQTADYPRLVSESPSGLPITWGALSSLTADEDKPGVLYAVNDGFYRNQAKIITIDARQTPAKIVAEVQIKQNKVPFKGFDLEGITTDGDGGFWVVSNKRSGSSSGSSFFRVDAQGQFDEKQGITFFPNSLPVHCQKKCTDVTGIARVNDSLWFVFEHLKSEFSEKNTKLISYNLKTKTWSAVLYPLDKIVGARKGKAGLSDIAAFGDNLYVLERDNLVGGKAQIKRIYRIFQTELNPVKVSEKGSSKEVFTKKVPTVRKKLVRDLLLDFKKFNGIVPKKVDGLAIDVKGLPYIVTHNEGLKNSVGETYFFSTGGLLKAQ